MNSSKPSALQCTERRFFSSNAFLWTVASASILLLSACFITRCIVTYHSFQICDEKKFRPHENLRELSCNNDGSGITGPTEFLYHAKPKKKEYFIGLTDQVVEGEWQWVDDTPFTESLSFWDAGEPNNLITLEDCATIRDSSNARKNWNDIPCFYNMFRICEMPEINAAN
ncbi:C-type lectin domain family 4 member E isoform X2 [Urocitellus parryii]